MFIEELKKYDGTLLHRRFAYRYFRENCHPLGDIIIFRGEMEVLAEGMLDQEDVLNKAFIWSEDALNILWELPVLGNNSFGAVAYQRLFNTQIAELLMQEKYLNRPIKMRGDDIMVQTEEGLAKASVSITHVAHGAALGHTGINIVAGSKAPAGVYSTHLSYSQIQQFTQDII